VYTTTDGHLFTDYRLRVLIGASPPTKPQRQEAVALLREALRVGVTRGDLWNLANTAVWGGLDAARQALQNLTRGQSPHRKQPGAGSPEPAADESPRPSRPPNNVLQTRLLEL
jgi:hypothetical protein